MFLFSDSQPFFKANFHCHTTNSDGRLSPDECVKFYKDSGYDILAITDHRTVTPPPAQAAGRPLLIPGIEIDYLLPGQWVHVLGIGMDESIGRHWNRGGTPQEAHRAASARRAGDDPSTRRERATGRLCAVLRGAEGGSAWA